ncbi:hypothetical protein MED222_05225 [Vibrio sp. MED222]|nr:hypothetical protein MED222_05225 [Vibrio sp. MED222]
MVKVRCLNRWATPLIWVQQRKRSELQSNPCIPIQIIYELKSQAR